MIYSEDYWKREGEGKRFVPVSTGLSWVRMAPLLQNAQNEFLVPLIGKQLSDELDAIYTLDPSERQDIEERALSIAQRAVVNLALYANFDALSLRITDQGFQRQSSDDWQPAYKYQEDNLRRSFANAGFNALDQLLIFFEDNIEEFEKYQTSPAYMTAARSIVKSTREVQEVYEINDSRIVFMRLRPVMLQIQELALQPAIGDKLYDGLMAWLEEGQTTVDGHEYNTETWEQLRTRCRKVVVMAAVEQLLRNTGTVTERGAFFAQTASGGGGNVLFVPVGDNRLSLMLSDAEKGKEGYISRLTTFVKTHMPEVSGGDPLRVLDRDNDNKNAFWA